MKWARLFLRNWTGRRSSFRFSCRPTRSLISGTTAATGVGLAAVVGFEYGGHYDHGDLRQRAIHQVETDHKLSKRELRFLQFASIEYDDVIYMTPMDFIDSLTLDHPRERVYRHVVKPDEMNYMLSKTPPFRRGSKQLFRTLDQKGIISYSEYIFLLTLLTKSKAAFKIAFQMFDADDNGRIDKDEFLLIRSLTSSLRSTRRKEDKDVVEMETDKEHDSCQLDTADFQFVVDRLHTRLSTGMDSYAFAFAKSESEVKKQDTSLLIHLFGLRGQDKLSFEEFRLFYERLQDELMEIEFHEFARGKTTISPVDFARLILRYSIVNKDDYHRYLQRVHSRTTPDEEGITLEQWSHFSVFLNNLQEFSTAVRLYANANVPVTQAEFIRAVESSIGQKLDTYVVSLIYRIFDANNDGTLSYNEFLAVMNDRLHRGLKGRLDKTWGWRQFRSCVLNELARNA